MKKNIITICFLLTISLACKAQKSISKIDAQFVKTLSNTYKLDKSNTQFINVENSLNKLSKVKPIAPNWPLNISSYKKITLDQNLLVVICTEILSLEKIKNLPKGLNDALAIRIKADINGKPLEISFLTEMNSLFTVNELEKIESQIKKRVTIKIAQDFKKYLIGANFIVFDTQVHYKDMLTARQ